MDWPHDPDGEQGSEGRRQYGHAVLAKKINEEEDFPLSAADYVEQYGDHPIRIDYETVVSVEEIFGASRKRNSGTSSSSSTRNSARAMRENGYWFYEGAEQFVDGSA